MQNPVFSNLGKARATLSALIPTALYSGMAILGTGALSAVFPAAYECLSRTGDISAHPDKMIAFKFLGLFGSSEAAYDLDCFDHTQLLVRTAGIAAVAIGGLFLAAGAASTTRSRIFTNKAAACFDVLVRQYSEAESASQNDVKNVARTAVGLVEIVAVARRSLVRDYKKTETQALNIVREALGVSMAKAGDPDKVFALYSAVQDIQPELIAEPARRVLKTHAAIMAP